MQYVKHKVDVDRVSYERRSTFVKEAKHEDRSWSASTCLMVPSLSFFILPDLFDINKRQKNKIKHMLATSLDLQESIMFGRKYSTGRTVILCDKSL